MSPEEYANLESVEARHWFYAGKREIVRRWLERMGVPAPGAPGAPPPRLADIGAGTGAFAAEMAARGCAVTAVDDHEESLELLRRRLGAEQVRAGSCLNIPLADGSCDAVTALDVLEHIADDRAAFAELVRVTRPGGGVIVVTVPAFMSLWSDWDVSLHHHRRYRAEGLRALIEPHADVLEIRTLRYINTAVFPLVFLTRRAARWRRARAASGRGRLEDAVPPAPLNALLRRAFVEPACWPGFQVPFGVGLLAVLVKKPGPPRGGSLR